jgi:hypothetical protein
MFTFLPVHTVKCVQTLKVCPYGPRCHFVHEPQVDDGVVAAAPPQAFGQVGLDQEAVNAMANMAMPAYQQPQHMPPMQSMPSLMTDNGNSHPNTYINKMQQLEMQYRQMQMQQMPPNMHMYVASRWCRSSEGRGSYIAFVKRQEPCTFVSKAADGYTPASQLTFENHQHASHTSIVHLSAYRSHPCAISLFGSHHKGRWVDTTLGSIFPRQ